MRAAVAATGLMSLAVAARADAPPSPNVSFRYQQKKLCYSRNGAGGLAHVAGSPKTAGAPMPLVVFLHGMNSAGDMHMWMGDARGDLRALADAWVARGEVEPFVLSAPTHTRFATGSTVMWPTFDAMDFVNATEQALGGRVKIDRTRVILVGHSAAGCNTQGGLWGDPVQAQAKSLRAVVAVDTCLDEPIAERIAALGQKTQIMFLHQPGWRRPVGDLGKTCETARASCQTETFDGLHGNPHEAILPVAMLRALSTLIPGTPAPPAPPTHLAPDASKSAAVVSAVSPSRSQP
jgi:pimeloyl-ACP methyl ester carboxylesterase